MYVLAGIDLSSLSNRVAAEAGALARATGAELVLLHAVRTEPVLASGGVAPPQGHRAPPPDVLDRRLKMDALVAHLRSEGAKVSGRVELCDDSPHELLLREATALGASYIVLGSHGHGRVFELLTGSVTQGVIWQARVPVVVVPSRGTPDDEE